MTALEDVREELLALGPAQQTAVEALAAGSTHAAAAEAAGVSRETVTRWAGHHPAVRAALDVYRATLAAEQVDTVRAIRSRGLAIVAEKFEDDIDLASALAVLRTLAAPPETPGLLSPLSAEMLLDEEQARTRRRMPRPEPTGDSEGELLALLDGTAETRERERAERLTLTHLAAAAGIE